MPSKKRPEPILCTKIEGGEFYPWPLPRQSCLEDHRVHSIFFDDGSILDSTIGRDKVSMKVLKHYVKIAKQGEG
jgi:hypothetical protein